MKLKVLATGSKGNCYILENDTEALVIEAGIPFKELIKHINHRKIVGCIVSHEHKDHAGFIGQYQARGIDTYTPYTLENANGLKVQKGGFSITPFENHHNVPCYGFIIRHIDLGQLVFATDTGYIEYTFKSTNHWLIECNYSKELMDRAVDKGLHPILADRIVNDHMSLETCLDYLKANNLTNTNEIVLIHLSDGNSDAEQFKKEIYKATNKDTYIAEKGLEIDVSLYPI